MKQRDWKAEAIKQWNADPCGADRTTTFGTPEFFAHIDHKRYVEYAPWLPQVVGFDRYAEKRLLEIGVGLGADYISFARAGARCFGIDLTPVHIEATRRRLLLEHYPVRLTRGDAESLPFADQCMDAVYSFGVLHHTPDTRGAIQEIFRVLRPGGEAIVGLYHRGSAFYLQTVLVRGLLRGGFFRYGYRRTMSQIEQREHSDAIPLVKVYSRREARRLFSGFGKIQIEARHFGYSNSRFAVIRKLAKRYSEVLDLAFGWYLIVRARKPPLETGGRKTGRHPGVSRICSAGFLSISRSCGIRGFYDTGFSPERLRPSLPLAARVKMILSATKAQILKT